MDQSLVALVKAGKVKAEDAAIKATDKVQFDKMIAAAVSNAERPAPQPPPHRPTNFNR